MERRELEYFLAIAEHGSFTGAAQALRVAQPSLSHAIGALEQKLGGRVFHRLAQGVSLTPAGEALAEPARQVLRDLDTAGDSVRQVLGVTGGRLDIVAQTTLAVDPLAALVGQFLRDRPLVSIHISDPELGSDITGSVRAGECELGMIDSHSPVREMDSMVLPGREIFAVLPPWWSSSERARISVAELAALDFVTTPEGTATREVIEDVVGTRSAPPRVAVETAHQAMIVPLVLAGAGATLLPRSMAQDAAQQGAVVLPLRPRVVRRGVLFWRSGPLSPAAAEFVELARGLSGEPTRGTRREP
ncbi:DNA-binding transcriptional LysR family regulator [Saccharopolyspora lacisalsi]|uniref:DNA-binding transcriptional LysR family regulator n=1 Tax=Halosaccharopolyspora lacisalsi TaxID=1000566 RepID=A0A839DTD2_9PSEU|nr:LysR family transcriptional regulator [Halosaccharopolyspora lacisalsi]MBA8824303.1 DNA-binding transcriptional LysR family regulator [Halosaccharopolyspora lacisalsi]